MLASPKNVFRKASGKEDENWDFRSFLKFNADSDEFDEQCRKLHEELFSKYDCSKCRNCCKEACGFFSEEDIKKASAKLKLSVSDFKDKFLEKNAWGDAYEATKVPCNFLKEGKCVLGDCKPEKCDKFPYTDQPDRIGHLNGLVSAASICPVAYEIMERLKKIYCFRD